ncbi:AAA family ATPase [Salinigranum rubrum]|nr:AAA family ATPase [Salinigranum rubrum]
MHMSNGVVFAVAGSKGGVGKTTTSINLSAVLAEEGYDVVLVEVDLAMANVGDFLDIDVGLEGEDPTLHEALAGTATVVDATYDSPCAFDVVPSGASLRGYGDADVGGLSEILSTLRFAYDVVVLDTGAGVTVETVLPLALADETILVSSPRVASVRDTMKTRDLTRQVGGSVAGVVFVRSGTGRSPDVDHIADFLSVDLLGHVPEDSAVPNAQDVGLPVVVAESESRAAAGYRDLGARIRERIDALDAPSAGTLSAESFDRDGSGFAFVDRPTEGDEDEGGDANEPRDDTDRSDRRAASVVSRTTNGHAGGLTEPTRDGTDRAARGTDEGPSLTQTGPGSDTGEASSAEPDGRTDGPTGVGRDEPVDDPRDGTDGEAIGESDTAGGVDTEGRPGGVEGGAKAKPPAMWRGRPTSRRRPVTPTSNPPRRPKRRTVPTSPTRSARVTRRGRPTTPRPLTVLNPRTSPRPLATLKPRTTPTAPKTSKP